MNQWDPSPPDNRSSDPHPMRLEPSRQAMTLPANSCMALRRSVTDRAVDLKDMRYYSRLFRGMTI
jgi:hypothetical protein